jgi:putative heme-binding domain-containing protein
MRPLLLSLLLAAAATAAQAQSDNLFIGNVQAVQDGKAVYDRTCTACHGPNAGAGERAPAIVSGAATAMRGERSDAQLLAVIRNGVPGTAMPAWKGRLSDTDILKLGAWLHALRGTALDNPLPGDPARGEAVFWGKGQCGTCHAIYGRGGGLGPDLSNIAAIRKSTAISDALTKVEHRVYGDGGVHLPMIPAMNYEPVHVVTKTGASLDGVMRNQDAWSIQFMDMGGTLHSFDRGELASVTIRPGSIMPTDYDKRLSPDEFRDLLAFLTRQGSRPGPRAAGVE